MIRKNYNTSSSGSVTSSEPSGCMIVTQRTPSQASVSTHFQFILHNSFLLIHGDILLYKLATQNTYKYGASLYVYFSESESFYQSFLIPLRVSVIKLVTCHLQVTMMHVKGLISLHHHVHDDTSLKVSSILGNLKAIFSAFNSMADLSFP